jgi:polysaccharide pyruvyl transferase WcaK-like protein
MGKILGRIARVVGFGASAKVLSRFMGVHSVLPFVFSTTDFDPPTAVAYNAVGGSHLGAELDTRVLHAVQGKLQCASYISVRDKETKAILEAMSIDSAKLSPDCAVLLSRIFPIDELTNNASPSLIEACHEFRNGYVCFQSALAHVDGNSELIAKKLLLLSERTSLGVMIFVIGSAPGHLDQVAAAQIVKHIPQSAQVRVTLTKTVQDVMYVIAHS